MNDLNPSDGELAYELDRAHVFHSWSAQGALKPLVIASGAVTILARNPVHSVLWLILAFFNAAGLMVLVGAEFIAMLLVIVYVGAVAVLFLFVVMMLDIDFAELRAGFVRNFPLGMLVAVVLICEIVLGIGAYRAGALHLGTPDGSAATAQEFHHRILAAISSGDANAATEEMRGHLKAVSSDVARWEQSRPESEPDGRPELRDNVKGEKK